uniref:Uncharacterized protein n=1 Tax=Percolomonas cosmopolitus TaxID=63605 RepID=A0A7S1PG89_9EUKA|mmetsp:Transcript_2585/g.9896  ORF Transcript_2585/g.9896 Transcript_2585/m.9896 type:complete len:434 (+) Transcript_2585:231-1532(+)|eukprot:CAMPEP_0117439924 /NCGR_PEP_ID=MMETSP0759-20121206/2812_1 /TAXON_ID=63605 /ORGANISM="Percolomonas cosmopolitus, Strain WS" /LENGTH=433 /DNA_ID=CAMNT_0005231647 /DNA_START=221 /DNA_END=1522 /DNA_ORIENTATION=-
MNVLDSITKTPSQVLVKSATNFGQDAAKIIGAYAEECIKNSTDDVLHEIREATEKLSETLKETLNGFGDTFHKTGVEAFTEWGIGIERAFLHLGQKLETGLTNSTNRVAYTIRDTMDETLWRLRRTITSSSSTFADAFAQFGLKHAEVYKHVFRYEIMVAMFCAVLVSVSLCIFALTAATKMGLTGTFVEFVTVHFVPICFLMFAILNAYVIFASTHHNSVGGLHENIDATREANIMSGSGADDDVDSPLAPPELSLRRTKSRKRDATTSSNAAAAATKKENNLVVYAIVASIGYMGGNLSTQIFTFSSLNFLVSFVIMISVTLLAHKVFAFNVLYRIYSLYQHIQEFRLYLKEKQKDDLLVEEPFETTSVEPQSAVSKNSDWWSDEEEALEKYRDKVQQRHRMRQQEVSSSQQESLSEKNEEWKQNDHEKKD